MRRSPSAETRLPGIGVPESGPVPRQMAHHVGLTQDEHQAFQGASRELGWDVNVRAGNPSRIPHVGSAGSLPKPQGLYPKTAKQGPDVGLVVAGPADQIPPRFQMPPGGGAVRDTVTGRHVHGDIDLKSVYHGAERVPEDEYKPKLNAALDRGSRREYVSPTGPAGHADKVQHGAHDDWAERNNMAYYGGVNAGPIPGVVSFYPGGPPRASYTTKDYLETLKSRTGSTPYTAGAMARGKSRDLTLPPIATVKSATLHPRPPGRSTLPH
jgi:insecticidal toxin complex protein TccC